MRAILNVCIILVLAETATSLNCWHCLPTGGEKLCNDGFGRSVSCSSGDSVCIRGTTIIDGQNATVRSCLDGSKYEDEACIENSSELSGIPSANFCVCTNDLCNDANRLTTSNHIINLVMPLFVLLIFTYRKFTA